MLIFKNIVGNLCKTPTETRVLAPNSHSDHTDRVCTDNCTVLTSYWQTMSYSVCVCVNQTIWVCIEWMCDFDLTEAFPPPPPLFSSLCLSSSLFLFLPPLSHFLPPPPPSQVIAPALFIHVTGKQGCCANRCGVSVKSTLIHSLAQCFPTCLSLGTSPNKPGAKSIEL